MRRLARDPAVDPRAARDPKRLERRSRRCRRGSLRDARARVEVEHFEAAACRACARAAARSAPVQPARSSVSSRRHAPIWLGMPPLRLRHSASSATRSRTHWPISFGMTPLRLEHSRSRSCSERGATADLLRQRARRARAAGDICRLELGQPTGAERDLRERWGKLGGRGGRRVFRQRLGCHPVPPARCVACSPSSPLRQFSRLSSGDGHTTCAEQRLARSKVTAPALPAALAACTSLTKALTTWRRSKLRGA